MKTNVELIKEEVGKIVANAQALKDQVEEVRNWNSFSEITDNIERIFNFVMNTILVVEIAVNNLTDDVTDLKAEDKLEAAAQMLDDVVKLPWYLEAVDKLAFQFGLSLVVANLNKHYGHDWNLDFINEAIDEGKNFIDVMKDKVA